MAARALVAPTRTALDSTPVGAATWGAVAVTAVISLAIAGSALAAEGPSRDQYAPNRVEVCHRSSTKPLRFVDRVVARSSLAAHLRHGDTVGTCVYGSVSRQGAVSLTTGKGAPVVTLVAGRVYSIIVRDPSPKENFHLTGTSLSRMTTARFVGTVRWKVTLRSGSYRYRSDAQPALRRFLRVH